VQRGARVPPPDTIDRQLLYCLGGMLQNFLQRAPGSAGNVVFVYTLAQGEMLPNFLRGVFPGVAASYWAFP
jgi:hypothetical protein